MVIYCIACSKIRSRRNTSCNNGTTRDARSKMGTLSPNCVLRVFFPLVSYFPASALAIHIQDVAHIVLTPVRRVQSSINAFRIRTRGPGGLAQVLCEKFDDGLLVRELVGQLPKTSPIRLLLNGVPTWSRTVGRSALPVLLSFQDVHAAFVGWVHGGVIRNGGNRSLIICGRCLAHTRYVQNIVRTYTFPEVGQKTVDRMEICTFQVVRVFLAIIPKRSRSRIACFMRDRAPGMRHGL
ncbi:hypothetical protein C8Q77DRAFT_285377 [Trametes polyzona]|nr:hypothetical protein C8Q77DRAFT_285377 [Trametes polyzona]